MSSLQTSSSPESESHSPGSSASTRLQEEYDDLLRYAVVTPQFDPRSFPPLPETRRRSPLAQAGVMAREVDVLADGPQENATEEEGTGESSQTDSGSGEPGSHLVLPVLEHNPGQNRESHLTSGTPHKLGHVGMPPLVVDDVSPGSIVGDDSVEGNEPVVDQEMMRIELQLDSWTLELKRNILAEFGQTRIGMLEKHRQDLETQQERHSAELSRVHNELEGCKELLVTYEQSIARKDHIITNLTRALQKQKDKLELQKNFAAWKLRHCDEQREEFASKLARKHYDRHISGRVWDAWHGILENKWRQRVEKACQARAEDVCHKLSAEYEERLAELNESLQTSQTEVAHLQAERQAYEETMKRAFMRGVCALNLEAMSMFREGTAEDDHEATEMSGGVQSGWLPPNPVAVTLEAAQQMPFVETAVQPVESPVEPPPTQYQSRHVVASTASQPIQRRHPPSTRTSTATRTTRTNTGNVFVERHGEGDTTRRQTTQTGKVPAARIGVPKSRTASGTNQRRPAVKVVQ